MSVEALQSEILAVENLVAQGRYREALRRCLDAIAARTAARNRDQLKPLHADLQVIERLAELAVLQGETGAAVGLFEAYARFAQAHGNDYALAMARFSQAQVLFNSADLQAADQCLYLAGDFVKQLDAAECSMAGLDRWEQSAAWARFPPDALPVLLTRFYLTRGRLLMANGQYTHARMLLERGLHHSGEANLLSAQRARIMLQLSLAQVHMECGELSRAQQMLSESELRLDRTIVPGSYVERCQLSAQIYLMRGELGEGVRNLRRILDFCRENGFDRGILIAAIELAHVEIRLNRTAEAVESLQQVRAVAAQSGMEDIGLRAALVLALARSRVASATDSSSAESVTELWGAAPSAQMSSEPQEVLPELPPAGSFLTWLDNRLLGVQQRLGRAEFDSAKRAYQAIARVFSDADSRLVQARLCYAQGLVTYYQGDYAASLALLQKAVDELEQMELLPEVWQARRIVAWCLRRLGRPEQECATAFARADELLERMTASLPAGDRAVFLLNKWTAEEEAIGRLSAELITLRRKADRAPRLRRLAARIELWRRTADLANRMDLRKAQVAEGMLAPPTASPSQPPLSWLAMLTGHTPRRLTLSFLVLPDRVLVLQRGFLKLDLTVTAITRVKLRQVVRGWHESIRGDSREREQLRTLRERTIRYLGTVLGIEAIVAKQPRWVRALTLEPDDILHGFPFAALELQGRYLIERFACSVRSHVAGFFESPPTARSALVVGISSAVGGAPVLRGVKKEARRVRTELQQCGFAVRMLSDSEASVETVRAQLPTARVVHWAGHGTFMIDQPDQSGLVLVEETQGPTILSLRELSTLNLSGVRQISLSCCWSADNYVTPSRWVISLPQALCSAGAHNVLGSLWEVPDAHSALFMTTFYQQLAHLPIERALQAAQIAWLQRLRRRGARGDPEDPRGWAGFVLHSRNPGKDRHTGR